MRYEYYDYVMVEGRSAIIWNDRTGTDKNGDTTVLILWADSNPEIDGACETVLLSSVHDDPTETYNEV